MYKFKTKTKDCQLIIKTKLAHVERLNQQDLDIFASRYIRGLFKFGITKNNMIVYTGPVGISLFERLKKPISKYDFFFIMEQIVDLVQKLCMNGLMLEKVVLDIRYVYINETTKELQFIYLPVLRPMGANILGFIEHIIYSTKPLQENDTDYISRFVYFIKSLQMFDPQLIEQFIFKEDRSIVNTIKKHNIGQSGFMTDKQVDYYAHYQQDDNATELLDCNMNKDQVNSDDDATGLLIDDATGLLNDEDDDATGLLNEVNTIPDVNVQPQVQYATLVRILNDENILINKPVFRIGKEKSYSDYFVSNNDKVSRSHADIISRGNKVFIMDLNSKNKTYVNGQAIPVQQETEIFNGDHIRLANEEFLIHI